MTQQVELSLSIIRVGQELEDPDGNKSLALEDGICISTLVDGVPVAAVSMTTRAAWATSKAITSLIGDLLAMEVGDDGKPTSALHRLRRINELDRQG